MNTGLDIRKCLPTIHPLSSNPLERHFFEAIIAHMKWKKLTQEGGS
jgi:hypothetical protein